MGEPHFANMLRICASSASSNTSSRPVADAIPSRVTSSTVGPDPATGDDDIGTSERQPNHVRDPTCIVADRAAKENVDADLGQTLREPGGVGVDDFAEE